MMKLIVLCLLACSISFGQITGYPASSGGGVGAPGAPGQNGAGYAATSTTSVAIATGSATFTTQTGLAYSVGARARAAYATTPTDYVEGLVTGYSGTSLVINVDTVGGTGTYASWNINLAGSPGSVPAITMNHLVCGNGTGIADCGVLIGSAASASTSAFDAAGAASTAQSNAIAASDPAGSAATAQSNAIAASAQLSGSYSNPSWITALANSKITGLGSAALQPSSAFAGNSSSSIIALFSGCTGTQYLGADGACHTPSSGTNATQFQGQSVTSTTPSVQGQVLAWDTTSSSYLLSSRYLYTDSSGNFSTNGAGTMYSLTLTGPQVFNGFNFGDANSNLIYKYGSPSGTIACFPYLNNSIISAPVQLGSTGTSCTGGLSLLTNGGPLLLNGAYFPYAYGSNTGIVSGQSTVQIWDSTHTYAATMQVGTGLTANYNINFPYSTGAAVSVPNLNAGNVWAGGVQNFTAAVTYPYQLGLIASLPTTCTASEMYFASDVSLAGSGQQLNGCWGSNSFGIYPMWFQTFSALGDQPIPNANFGIVVQHSPIVAGHYYWSNRPTSTSPVNSVWEPGVPLSDVTLNGTCVVATQYLGEDGNCHTPGFQMQGNGVGSTLTYNTTTYVSVGASVAMSTVASTHYIMMANAGTINTLFLQTVTANGTSAFTCTMQKLTAGTVTAQTMAISMAASDAAQIYYDTTHPFTVAARDVIYLSCVNSGGTVASAAIGAVSIGFVNN